MKKDIYFSASADIARRAGIIASRYRTKDGRFIITNNDLGRIQLAMTPEEFMNGIDAVRISEAEANRLIAENKYQMGEDYADGNAVVEETEEVASSSSSEEETKTENENNEEE